MPDERKTSDALRTYRYLRIGMLGAVVLLGAAVVKEGQPQACWETSISAYWYTPAKPVLVGVLVAIGFAMIVIKGRTVYEDTALNVAGMLAPVVALVPTGSPEGHQCDVTVPTGLDEMVDNNVWALLAAGLFCLGVGFVITAVLNQRVTAPFEIDTGTWVTLVVTTLALGAAILLNDAWDADELIENVHGNAARLMFVGMFLAAVFAAIEARNRAQRRYFAAYLVTAVGMASGLVVLGPDLFGAHEVLALETWEILWFGAFWAVQTAERWDEPPAGSSATVPEGDGRLLRT